MESSNYIGKLVQVFGRKWKNDKLVLTDHLLLTKGKVVQLLPNSRTMFVVEDVDRGKGYCELTRSFKGYRVGNGWVRGENRGYGEQIHCHLSQLTLIEQ